MKYAVVFIAVLFVASAFVNKVEAAPVPDDDDGFGKELERAGQRIFAAAEKLLPVAQGYADLLEKIKGLKKDDDE